MLIPETHRRFSLSTVSAGHEVGVDQQQGNPALDAVVVKVALFVKNLPGVLPELFQNLDVGLAIPAPPMCGDESRVQLARIQGKSGWSQQ